MIGFLRGIPLIQSENYTVIDCNGVGYKVKMPYKNLPNDVPCPLYIYTSVKEDDISLYGFKTEAELKTFETLITVSGVGPKSAQAILNTHSVTTIANALNNEDVKVFSSVSGVGKKTAEKIIIELRGKLSNLVGEDIQDDLEDVKLALEALGYNGREISETVKSIDKEGKSTAEIIREALKYLQK